MRPHALVDLYVPARSGPVQAIQATAREAGLDALVYVFEPEEAPEDEALEALDPAGPAVFLAAAISGPGYRYACILPRDRLVSLEAIEAQGDPQLIQAGVRAMGGLALPICPRQSDHGAVVRDTPRPPSEKCGVVALAMPGSRLGRDLDLEDAAVAERPILGASGPFATRADIGRYATLLPLARREDVTGLVRVLAAGEGIAVEQGPRRRQEPAAPDPAEGRDDERGPHKKRRRRRRGKSRAED